MENIISQNENLEPTLECVTSEETFLLGCGPGDCSPVNDCNPDY